MNFKDLIEDIIGGICVFAIPLGLLFLSLLFQ